ncbi:hypothetical protein [Chryseobacterium sp. MYb328]|uniref:hypothetical protein n=1 Tax=Chryseobacterium sp. MYb328 TaxID=2745231 RepID=UPI0030B404E4
MKYFLSIFTIFLSIFCFSQLKVVDDKGPKMIEVGKVGPMGTTNISMLKSEDDKIYCFEYQDMKFTQINTWKKFCFINENDDINNLYNLIIDGFEKNINNEVKLESQLHYITLRFEKQLGVMNFDFAAKDKSTGIVGYSRYLSKKQVNKLFGKTK